MTSSGEKSSEKVKALEQYWPILEKVYPRILRDVYIETERPLKEIFTPGRKILTIINHSTPLSWLPAICLLADEILKAGGGKRRPIGVMDRFFFQHAALKPLAQFISQFDSVLSFDEIMQKFDGKNFTDVVIFPEGSNCFFGPGDEIQEFRSPRFLELALKTQSEIFLVVHRGSEDWALPISMQSQDIPFRAYLPGWLNEKISRTGILAIPKWPAPIDKFKMKCEIYRPSIDLNDLPTSRRKRLEVLWAEAEKVQNRMRELNEQLDQI